MRSCVHQLDTPLHIKCDEIAQRYLFKKGEKHLIDMLPIKPLNYSPHPGLHSNIKYTEHHDIVYDLGNYKSAAIYCDASRITSLNNTKNGVAYVVYINGTLIKKNNYIE